MAFSITNEPILEENEQRFVLFPIKYHEVWRHYKKAFRSFVTEMKTDFPTMDQFA